MAISSETYNKDLFSLLKTKGYRPVPLDFKGDKTNPEEAVVFEFQFKKDGERYGISYVTVDNDVIVYYDDEQTDSPSSPTKDLDYDDTWSGFLKQMKHWAMNKQLGFDLSNKDRLGDDLAQRKYTMDKEKINEGYYPMGKQQSYSDAIPAVKIILQHTRQIQEGEQRYRNIAKIFLENQNGERFLAPTTRPGIAQVYARHIAEGGVPNDERWNHIKGLCEEYSKMAGFVRAVKNNQFNESAQQLVNEGINHYQSLRETLGKMRGQRGYNTYFESWTPTLMEDENTENTINELFVQETLDPRIESVLPILSKLHKSVAEMKEVDELAEWADQLTEAPGAMTLKHNQNTEKSNLKAFDLDEDDDAVKAGQVARNKIKKPAFMRKAAGEKPATLGDVERSQQHRSSQAMVGQKGQEVEESGLQAYLGNKKYGKDGMDALRKAGRDGASKEKMAKIRAKYDKLDEEGVAEGIMKSLAIKLLDKKTPQEVANSAISAINKKASGTKMHGHPNFVDFKREVHRYVSAADSGSEAVRRSSDDHVKSLFKKYFSEGVAEGLNLGPDHDEPVQINDYPYIVATYIFEKFPKLSKKDIDKVKKLGYEFAVKMAMGNKKMVNYFWPDAEEDVVRAYFHIQKYPNQGLELEEQGVEEGLGDKKVTIQGLKNWIAKAEAEGYKVEEVMKKKMWRAVNPKTGGLKGTFHTTGTPGRGSLRGSGPDGTPADSGTLDIKQGVAEGSDEGKTQKYEMMLSNGKVKRFTAKDDADAKRIAKGHGAKSVIKMKGDLPGNKIAEQDVAEGSEQTNESLDRLLYLANIETSKKKVDESIDDMFSLGGELPSDDKIDKVSGQDMSFDEKIRANTIQHLLQQNPSLSQDKLKELIKGKSNAELISMLREGVAEGCWGFDQWGHDTWTDAQKEVARKKKNEKQKAQRQQNKDQQNKDQQKSKQQGVAEGLNEMDKSAPQPGRDGRVSHSTYGSRDKKGSDYFQGKEALGKIITPKQMAKDALDILKKQGVGEGEFAGHYKTGPKGQLGPTEKAKNISPVIGQKEKQHPFHGKLVGNESVEYDPLDDIKKLMGK